MTMKTNDEKINDFVMWMCKIKNVHRFNIVEMSKAYERVIED